MTIYTKIYTKGFLEQMMANSPEIIHFGTWA